MRNFLSKPHTLTVISQENGKIIGYGVISAREPAISEIQNSYKIGPLYANSKNIACQILESLLAIVKYGESAFLEIPHDNFQAVAMMQPLGLEKNRQTF